MSDARPRIEYVEARRVLLDALDAMEAHLDAIVLVGAQAVYLRTQGRLVGYQAFTTDADVVLDPAKLGPIPPLGQAMEAAGFTSPTSRASGRHDSPGPGSTTMSSCRSI